MTFRFTRFDTKIKKKPLDFPITFVLENELLEIYTNKEASITFDFDINKVVEKKQKGKGESSYSLKELQIIAKKLGINSNKNKPILVKEIRDRYYGN